MSEVGAQLSLGSGLVLLFLRSLVWQADDWLHDRFCPCGNA